MEPTPEPTRMRGLWIAAGLGLTGLALVGAMLPGVPTTVFAIGAAACFARSSPRLEAWLLAHRWLGPPVRAWRAERAIPGRAKVVALASMAASGLFTLATAPLPVALGVAGVLTASAAFVATRPLPAHEVA
jgi:uncharacterized membrane protein YbaN (DUF454 family)